MLLSKIGEITSGDLLGHLTWDLDTQADFESSCRTVDIIQHSSIIDFQSRDNIQNELSHLSEKICAIAVTLYTSKADGFEGKAFDDPIEPLLTLVDWISGQAKKLNKHYPTGILQYIVFTRIFTLETQSFHRQVDPVAHLLSKQVPLFLEDLRETRSGLLVDLHENPQNFPLPSVFLLYKRVKSLARMYKQAVTKSVSTLEMILDWSLAAKRYSSALAISSCLLWKFICITARRKSALG